MDQHAVCNNGPRLVCVLSVDGDVARVYIPEVSPPLAGSLTVLCVRHQNMYINKCIAGEESTYIEYIYTCLPRSDVPCTCVTLWYIYSTLHTPKPVPAKK